LLFPSLIDKAQIMTFYSRIKAYVIQLGEYLSKGEECQEIYAKIAAIYNSLQTDNSPNVFNHESEECILTQLDKNFVSMCCAMENNGSANPQKYTVIEFYAKLDYLKRSAEELDKG